MLRSTNPTSSRNASIELWSLMGAILLGIALFLVAFGTKILNAHVDGWLYSSIRMQYQAAWLAYRKAEWTFPLGHLPLFFYPVGSSVAYMDGAPLYTTLLKILLPILPRAFSAWGTWILIACTLQSVAAWALMRRLLPNSPMQWIGIFILTLNPVLMDQSVHFALLAHWSILFAWALYFSPPSSKSTWIYWILLIGIVSGTHPYLLAMVFSIRAASLLTATMPWREKLKDAFSALALSLAILALFGYFSNGATKDTGTDLFTADLLTFFNGEGNSSLLPALPQGPGDQEGFAYLGLGGMIAVFAGLQSIIAMLRYKQSDFGHEKKILWGALILSLLLALYAIGPTVRCGGKALFYNPLYFLFSFGKLKSIPGMFRMPGRFIWPLYYLLIALGCRALAQEKRFVVLLIAVLQLIDVGPSIADAHSRVKNAVTPPAMTDHHVALFLNRAKKIEFVPLQPGAACGTPETIGQREMLLSALELSASRHIPINSGLQARIPHKFIQPLCDQSLNDFTSRHFQDGFAYIVNNFLVPNEYYGSGGPLYCKHYSDISVCGTQKFF